MNQQATTQQGNAIGPSARRRLRSIIFRLHRWLGLNIALYFGFVFITGALLVWVDEIEALYVPGKWVSVPEGAELASFGDIYDKVSAAYPGGRVFVIERSVRPGLGDRAFLTTADGRKRIVWVDPRDGSVLAETSNPNLQSILRELHDSLMVPKRVGYLAVTSTSFILLYSVISGLITYRRFWRGYLRLPASGADTRGRWASIHRLAGVWVAPFLFLMAITGVFFFIVGLGLTGTVPKAIEAPPRSEVRPAGFDGTLIDRATAAAQEAYPGFEPVVLSAPGRARDAIRLSGRWEAPAILGLTVVSVDPVSLQVLGDVGPYDRRGNARISPVANALHFGNWGGQTVRVLWTLFGFASALLVFGGARVFLARTAPGAARGGGFRRYLAGLGPVRWLYLAAILAVAATVVVRFVL